MKKVLICLIYAFIMSGNIFIAEGASVNDKVDWAYPEQVAKNANSDLERALAVGDDVKAVRSLVQLGVARTLIDPDSIVSFYDRVGRLARERSKTVAGSVLRLLQAQVLADYYQNNRWNINTRVSVDGCDDIALMSGKQVVDSIGRLLEEATLQSNRLAKVKSSEWSSVFNVDEFSREMYPTLNDVICFLAYKIGESVDLNKQTLEVVKERWLTGLKPGTAPMVGALLATTGPSNDLSLYEANRATPYSIELLLVDDYAGDEMWQQCYDIFTRFFVENPDYPRVNAVKNAIAVITRPTISLVTERATIVKGDSIPVKVIANNVSEIVLMLYNGKLNGSNRVHNLAGKPVQTRRVAVDRELPYRGYMTTIYLHPDEYGIYTLAVDNGNGINVGSSTMTVTVTDMAMLTTSRDDRLYVVNQLSGQPIEGATIETVNGRFRSGQKLQTDAGGMVKVPIGAKIEVDKNREMMLRPVKGKDRYAQAIYYKSRYGGFNKDVKTDCYGKIRTSQSVYQPGDTIDWVFVGYSVGPEKRELLNGCLVKVLLQNVNGETVDSMTTVTDSWGRCVGKFAVPLSGITGNYTLYACAESDEIELAEYQIVKVADFKMADSRVTVNQPTVNGDSIVVTGIVVNRVGQPVSRAEVDLTAMYRRWWGNREIEMTDKAATGSDGRFELCLPLSRFITENEKYVGQLELKVAVTTDSGETIIGERYTQMSTSGSISLSDENVVCDNGNMTVKVRLSDIIGNSVSGNVTLMLKGVQDDNRYEVSGEVSNRGTMTIDVSNIPSGEYKVTARGDGFEASDESIYTIYRTTDRANPSTNPLWTPVTTLTARADEHRFEVLFATSSNDVSVLATLSAHGEVVKQWWIDNRGGMQHLVVELPADAREGVLSLNTIRNYKQYGYDIRLKVDNPSERLTLSVNTVREYVYAGGIETLTIKVTDGDNNPRRAALIADIYNKALDAITASQGEMRFASYRYPFISVDGVIGSCYDSAYFSGDVLRINNVPNLGPPHFNMGGFVDSFGGRRPIYIRGRGNGMEVYKTATTSAVFNMMAATDIEAEDSSDAEAAEETVGDNGSQGDAGREIEYRDVDVTLALFEPMLTTDKDGGLTLQVRYPNTLATWVLDIDAFDDNLSAARFEGETATIKPVMVTANVPRYLRRGDRAVIRATVENGTDSVKLVEVRFALANPLTMTNLLPVQTQMVTVGAKSRESVSFELTVESAWDNVMVLVDASTERYTDGERHPVSILDATQPVLESETFYLVPATQTFQYSVKEGGVDKTVTLSFTANPVWEVLKALPGLRENAGTTSLSTAASLFSGAVGRKIITDNSTIVERLKQWFDGHQDDALLSALAEDSDLKQLLLNETPWVSEANSESERIARLSLLLDAATTDRVVEQARKQLEEMQNEDGGFGWIARSEQSSAWASEGVALYIARLYRLGCIDSEQFGPMIEKLMRYLDRNLTDRVSHSRDYIDVGFAWLCSELPMYKPSAVAKVTINRTLKRIKEEWRRLGLGEKALAAQLLHRAGDERAAKAVMLSLNEFSVYSPESGRSWPRLSSGSWWNRTPLITTALILEAYNEVMGDVVEVDQIREWLIFNKITQGWGDSADASGVIAAILQTGSRWIDASTNTIVKIDGQKMIIDEADSLTGAFRQTMPEDAISVEISRQDSVPAWGAVVSLSTRAMVETEPYGTKDLSINKQILVRRGERWIAANELAVGDVVKVVLTIEAGRRLDFVSIVDNRPATLLPVVMTPRYIYSEALPFYLENRVAATNLFIDILPKGKYQLEYEMTVNNAGEFASGLATVQSQYAPEFTAHSGGDIIVVK